jgi:hypothetical protein
MYAAPKKLLGSMVLTKDYQALADLRFSEHGVLPCGGASGLLGFGRGSPEYALLGSAGRCRSGGCAEGVGRLSGLLVLVVKVSLVVTCTLSVRLSSTPLFVRCEPEAVRL